MEGVNISVVQAALIAIYYFLSNSAWTTCSCSYYAFGKPLVGGWVVGLILGHPLEGLAIGAQIQLIYIANISAGGAASADPSMAGILGTALALGSGATAEEAILFAVPLGLVGNLRGMFHMLINSPITHISEKNIESGNYRKLFASNVLLPSLLYFLTAFTMVFVGCLYGPEVVSAVLANLPQWAINGLNAVGGVLPAVGITVSLNMIGKADTIPYFLIGFLLVKYLGLSTFVIAILGAIFAYIVVRGEMKYNGGNV